MPVAIDIDEVRAKGKVTVIVPLPALPTLTQGDEESAQDFTARQAEAKKHRQLVVLREAIGEANRANEAGSKPDADVDAEIVALTAQRNALKAARPTVTGE